MTSTIPAYLLPSVPAYQPAHLEGDSTYATEILPGPPSLAAVQNPLAKRDPRKDSVIYSYLPASDPGTTYSGAMHGTWIGQDSRKSKRAKMDKGCVLVVFFSRCLAFCLTDVSLLIDMFSAL